MKTLLIIPGFVADTMSSIENMTFELTEELSDKFNVIWLAPSIDNPDNHFRNKENRRNLSDPLYVIEAKKQGIKCITANLSKYNYFKNLIILKDIFKKENVDAVMVEFGFERYAGSICSKMLGKKVIYYEHGYPPSLKYPILRKIIYNTFVDHFIAISDNSANQLPKNKSVFTIKNSIPVISEDLINERKLLKKQCLKELGLKKHDVVVLMISSFMQRKRYDLAFKIMKKIKEKTSKNIGFVCLGNGVEYEHYKTYIKQEKLDEFVHLPGYTDTNTVEKYLAASDIFMHTSDFEGLPMCFLETMNYKMPIVSFNHSYTKGVITDKVDSLLIDIDDVDSFAEAVLSLAELPERSRRLGENGFINLKNNYGIQKWRANIKHVFEEIKNSESKKTYAIK